MSFLKRPRDIKLLDALDELERVSVDDIVWRSIRSDRDPLLGSASCARWDPGQFDVLYTSFDADGAVAEMHFHLSRQPVFPSKIEFSLNKISVKTQSTLKFADLRSLAPFGIDENNYSSLKYEYTQLIGDAAVFLGFDGVIAPNARWKCLNLVIFSDCIEPDDLELLDSSTINWENWKKKAVKKT